MVSLTTYIPAFCGDFHNVVYWIPGSRTLPSGVWYWFFLPKKSPDCFYEKIMVNVVKCAFNVCIQYPVPCPPCSGNTEDFLYCVMSTSSRSESVADWFKFRFPIRFQCWFDYSLSTAVKNEWGYRVSHHEDTLSGLPPLCRGTGSVVKNEHSSLPVSNCR